MPTVLISPTLGVPAGTQQYRATTADRESLGSTPGAALDALAAQLGPVTSERLVVLIEPRGEDSIPPEQRQRLDELKQLYRLASTGRGTMSAADRDEMERLFDAQFAASERRAAALASEPGA